MSSLKSRQSWNWPRNYPSMKVNDNQLNLIQSNSPSNKIHFNIILRSASRFSNYKLMCISHLPMCSTCSANLTLSDLITVIIFGHEYKLTSLSLWNFLHPPLASSFLRPNTVLRALLINTLNLCSSPIVTEQV